MLNSPDSPTDVANYQPRALLLCRKPLSSEDQNLSEVLDFFGIPWKAVTAEEISQALSEHRESNKFCILSSAPCVAEAIQLSGDSYEHLPGWMKRASSVYIYGFQDTDASKRLLRFFTCDSQGNIRRLNKTRDVLSIVGDAPEICGPMSGMSFLFEREEDDFVFDINDQTAVQNLMNTDGAKLFFAVTCEGVRFYLSGNCKIIAIRSRSAEFFDVKKYLSSAVPAVMYLKRAFGDVWQGSPDISGCLIVDDIPLKLRYGFLHFREALQLMDNHNFTTAIAFIPWNWRRTNQKTVGIIQKRPDRFSICFHGSDHTESEFATRSIDQLNKKIKNASQRMKLLFQKTSLPYARIMIFPQGAFSPEAGRALKLNGFMAAVNTEVAPYRNDENETTLADLWSVAIVKYGTFPIFTRRYMSHGVENFAFDGLLGKPCFIAAHHEVFKNHGRDLVDFISKLNSLKWNLRWRPLCDAISHSYSLHCQPDGTVDIRMFAQDLVMENSSTESLDVAFTKEEGDPDCVEAVMVNHRKVDARHDGEQLRWTVKLGPKQTAHVCVAYFDKLGEDQCSFGIGYGTKIMVRRYLSEFRDNYLSQNPFLYGGATRIKQLLHSYKH